MGCGAVTAAARLRCTAAATGDWGDDRTDPFACPGARRRMHLSRHAALISLLFFPTAGL